MGDSKDIAIDYSNRLIFDEPDLLVCDITDDDIAAMSLEDKLKVIADNMNQLRIVYESASDRINYSNTIIKIARDIHSIEYEGLGYFHMAIFFNASYKYYYRFKETMLQAVELLKNTQMYSTLASAYILLGVDANNYGQYNLNLDYFLLARQYAIMQNDPYIIALVHYFFSGFYILVNDLDTALEYALKSVEYYEKNLDINPDFNYYGSDGMDMAYCMLGQCYIFRGQYDEAINCYNKSMEREKLHTPHYDCPNTALIYAFHVMVLHTLSRYDERNAIVDEFINILENHTPSPPFFLHIVNIVFYLIRIGEFEYARRINRIMIHSGIDKDNPNFGLYISNIEIEIAKHYNDKERLSMAMGYFYDFYIKNNAYVLENLRRSTELRVEIDDIQKEKNELEVARAANLAKSNFLSNVSHEIRTPLNAILGMDELIMRETSDDTIYNYANDIKNAGNTLLGLINDILDSSKLDANKINIIAVEYDISSAINDLVNMVSQKAADKGLELKIDIDSSIPVFLYGDEIRIKQCALNILSNAIKYTEKGSVTLKVTSRLATSAEIDKASDLEYINTEGQKLTLSEDKWHLEGGNIIILRFSITDTGIGIKEQDLKKLDIPFERIEEERNRNIEGTGLGMSIVRRLLEMMGSRLEVESIYGKGSTFSFEIMQGAHSDEVLGDYTVRYKQNQSKRKEFRIEYHAPKARLLIVDDTPANLTVAKGLLKPIGAQIDTADSGEETLRMVQENRYDILLIDHRMPGMDGIETLQALKNLENNLSKGAPCIALTANAISGAREMFLSEGFDDYLTKPIDSDKLVKLVRYYLPANLIIASSNNSDIDIDAIENNNSPDSGFASAKEKLATIPGIDVDAALESCGNDIEILINTMKDFAFSAKKQPDIIESYLSAGDIRNYTVQVHGLKSAARFVGAIALSKAAEHLEKCGDEGNITEIEQKTPQLITDFKTIVGHMDSAISEIEMDINDIKDEAKDQPPKPVIDSSTLSEIYGGVKEFVSAHDYKSAENVLNMLSRYTVPEPDNSKVLEIRDMIRNVDHDGLLDIL